MQYKYGEQESAAGINELAKKMKAEGNKDTVYELAEENGIDKEMVDLFMEGHIDMICDVQTAAEGKLAVELKNYQKRYVSNAIEVVESLKSLISRERVKYSVHKYGIDIDIDITGEELAAAIRSKGKSLNDICKKVFTKAGEIHAKGNPASALVVPMIIQEYLQKQPEKKVTKKKATKKEDKDGK